MKEFDPDQDIKFRGKALTELTHDETLDALRQALAEIYRLRIEMTASEENEGSLSGRVGDVGFVGRF